MNMPYLLDMVKFDDKLRHISRLVSCFTVDLYKCLFYVTYGKDISCVYELILDVL